MKAVTRAVSPAHLQDLLERAPRASIAFEEAGRVVAAPVAFRCQAGHYWVGIPKGEAASQTQGEVKVLVDDGCYWFQLRGLSIRGRLSPAGEAPQGTPTSLDWFELAADKVVAWDYGMLREVGSHETG
jgi:hypothetical protein